MAGTDSQKQLLTLIRDVASEKSQGERRIVGLKKQIEEFRSELEPANSELEDAKCLKEESEQEIKGFEVELASNEALIQALGARIAQTQERISTVGSEVDMLKTEEAALRDQFISQMVDLNSEIRKFQKSMVCNSRNERQVGETKESRMEENVPEVSLENLENMLSQVMSQIAKEEEECLSEQKNQEQLRLELVGIERKVCLMETMMQETKLFEDLTRQTFELERAVSSLSAELQQRCICPRCHLDNVEALSGILQSEEAHYATVSI